MIVTNSLVTFKAVAQSQGGGSSRSGKTQLLHSRRQNFTAAASYIGRIGRHASASRIEPLSARRKIVPFFWFLVGIFRALRLEAES
jgi:hypothetical protein